MSIQYIDEIADAMVKVCVRDFGASPIDDEDGLLWDYFRHRLIESVRDVNDKMRVAQKDALKEVEDSYTDRSLRDNVQALQKRREIALQIIAEKEQQ